MASGRENSLYTASTAHTSYTYGIPSFISFQPGSSPKRIQKLKWITHVCVWYKNRLLPFSTWTHKNLLAFQCTSFNQLAKTHHDTAWRIHFKCYKDRKRMIADLGHFLVGPGALHFSPFFGFQYVEQFHSMHTTQCISLQHTHELTEQEVTESGR